MADSLCMFRSNPICLRVTYVSVYVLLRRLINSGIFEPLMTPTAESCNGISAEATTVSLMTTRKVAPFDGAPNLKKSLYLRTVSSGTFR